ncbi:MAG: sterol desaturase family protein [Acidiferrobacterales bacterium]|nr:sterol desaturase family protein [Acidiferrobacterales bacterium]
MLELHEINEANLRLGFFVGVFALLAIIEFVTPRRAQTVSKSFRWLNNIGVSVVNTLVLRFTLPVLATGMALLAHDHSFGIFNWISLPFWLACLLSFLIMDFAIYLQHRLFHAVPIFWRLHRMHHTDLEFDVTTAVRFHPVEILISMLIKLIIVALIGAPAVSILIFEIVLNGSAMFNHSNIKLPSWLDKNLRLILVTPDMHRVHHSVHQPETDSNFGFNLPWWDRLCGTYIDQPRDGHTNMQIGIEKFRDSNDTRLDKLLLQPLKDVDNQI